MFLGLSKAFLRNFVLFLPWQKVFGANIYVFSISGVDPSIILEKKETIFLIGLNQEQDQNKQC